MTEQTTVGQAVGRALAERGVAHVFAVVGSGNFFVTDALVAAGVPFVAARHEMGAAGMADAYTRLTGRVAAASVHQGCGLTNALTGIGEAAKAHTPILVVSGDTAVADERSNFVIDQDAAVAAIGAIPARITSAATAVAEAVAAFDTAVRNRAPVVLSLPVDLQAMACPHPEAPAAAAQRFRPGASDAAVERLADVLRTSERPVIVAGRGARHAASALRDLAARSGALLATSAAARGLFVGDEWALDVMGGFSTPAAAELIAGADVLVAFGAALNDWTAHGGRLTGQPVVVQVDDRPEAIGFQRPVTFGVVGDTAEVAAAVAARIDPGAVGYRSAHTAERVRAARYWVDQPHTTEHRDGLVDAVDLTIALDRTLPMERIVVPDGGNVNFYAGAFWRVPDERGYVVPLAFQSIGVGLAEAIGAGVAEPDRLPVLGVGDGAFMMSLVELDTAVRLGLGMVIVVYNDDAYGAEIHIFPDETDKHGIVRFPDTDIAAIARGYGCEGITVRSLDDLAPLEQWLAGPRDRPIVIDAKIAGHPTPLMADDPMH